MRRRRSDSMLYSYVYKPVLGLLIVVGLFGLVWLRSNFITVSYDLRTLEEQKAASLKEQKLLLAERSKLMALQNIDGGVKRNVQYSGNGLVFPDRARVISVKRTTATDTHKASLQVTEGERRPE